MSFIFSFDAFWTLVYLTLILYCIRLCHGNLRRRWRTDVRAIENRRIADFTASNARSLDERLKLRAKPNARLILAFNLNNSFTTTDRRVHWEFLKRASQEIHLAHTEDWIKLGEVSSTILSLCMEHFKRELPYVPLASCEYYPAKSSYPLSHYL
jgi:hypothetical protein